ncbi:MAG: S-layer domain protein, partial [Candidatus Moranbacteria bacterium GW2011_GWF2_35_39]
APTRTNYTFSEWNTQSDGNGTEFTDATPVITNITVFAIWNLNEHTLTYSANANGTISGTTPQTIAHGGNGTEVTAVPDANYHFTTWSDSVLTASRTDTNVTGDVSVTASFAIDTHTVIFQDYDTTELKVEEVNHGGSATPPADPERTGYTFTGWDTSYTNITTDTTITAEYTINNYTVTFDENGGDIPADPTTKNADYNTTIDALPTAPNRTNYAFSEWNTQADGNGTEFTDATLVTANITVYAQWTINSHTLTYTAGANGAIVGTTPQTINHGADGTAVTADPDDNYHFVEWSDLSTDNSRTDTNVTGDISVTANFVANPDIIAVDSGPSSLDRTSFVSDTWFNYVAVGSDDQISFSWTDPNSPDDDTFYYELNTDSGDTIDGTENNITNPYIDDISISEGTSYFHVKPQNGLGAWGIERKFILKYSKTPPTTPIVTDGGATTISLVQLSAEWVSTDAEGIADNQYCISTDSADCLTGTVVAWTSTNTDQSVVSAGLSLSDNTTYYFHIKTQDALGNWSEIGHSDGILTEVPETSSELASVPGKPEDENRERDEIEISWDENSNPDGTQYYAKNTVNGDHSGWDEDTDWTSKDLKCGKTYTFKVKARNAEGIETEYSDKAEIKTKSCPESLIQETIDLVTFWDDEDDEEEESAENEEFFVPLIPQPALAGNWSLVSSSSMEKFIALNIPKELAQLKDKLPQLEKIFQDLGLTKISDIEEIKNLKIALPKLDKLPDNFIIAKSEKGKIQLETKLEITEEGKVEKITSTLANQMVKLEIKPEGPVNRISGLIAFRSRKISEAEREKFWEILKLNTALAEIKEELILEKFEYNDSDSDGIYTAEIKTPNNAGEYEIITLTEYQDENLGTQKMSLTMIIDPEGYVYEKIKGREARIADAKTSLFWLNSETGQFELWKASDYSQENPQTTGADGKYSFLVPEGRYYLAIEASGYKSYKSEEFSVTEGRGIHLNIEMKSRGWLLKIFDWKTIIIILISILLAYNFYRDKMRNNKKI